MLDQTDHVPPEPGEFAPGASFGNPPSLLGQDYAADHGTCVRGAKDAAGFACLASKKDSPRLCLADQPERRNLAPQGREDLDLRRACFHDRLGDPIDLRGIPDLSALPFRSPSPCSTPQPLSEQLHVLPSNILSAAGLFDFVGRFSTRHDVPHRTSSPVSSLISRHYSSPVDLESAEPLLQFLELYLGGNMRSPVTNRRRLPDYGCSSASLESPDARLRLVYPELSIDGPSSAAFRAAHAATANMDPPTSAWPRHRREPRLRAAVLARQTAVGIDRSHATDPPSKATPSFGGTLRPQTRPDSVHEQKEGETQLPAPVACPVSWNGAEAHLAHVADAASVLILMAGVIGEFFEWSWRLRSSETGRCQHMQGMQLPCV